jgi:predicted PhzF superfamily epimerase YddE/YHI9
MGRESEIHVRVGSGQGGEKTFEVGGTAVHAGRGVLFV